MNAPIPYVSPAVALRSLDIAQKARTEALRSGPRRFNTGFLTFERLPSYLSVSFPQFGGDYTSAVEIIRVGTRFGIVRMQKVQGIVERSDLLSALRKFRREAAAHLEDWRQAEMRGTR